MGAQDNTAPQTAVAAADELTNAVAEVLSTLRGEETAQALEHLLSNLAAYAWLGVGAEDSNYIEQMLTEISVVIELLGGNLMNCSGETLVSQDTRQYIHRVASAANARHNIDNDGQVTIEWLAALANVSERTVRAATSSSNPNGMPIVKDGHWTFIEGAHALRWLSQRKDFIPTQVADDKPRAAMLRAGVQVGEQWRKWRLAHELSVDKLAKSLEWSDEQMRLYSLVESGEWHQDVLNLGPSFWNALALRLSSEEPGEVAIATFKALTDGFFAWRVESEL